MALPMVHLLTAHAWAAQDRALSQSSAYYLGAIAPDAIHARPGAAGPDKRITHLGTRKGQEVAPVLAFWEERMDAQGYLSAFDIGYGIHVLTDRIWVQFYVAECPELLDEQGHTIPSLYYNDTDQVDFLLEQQAPERDFLFDMLAAAVPPQDFPLLSAREMAEWAERVAAVFVPGQSKWQAPIRYLTLEKVRTFIARAPGELDTLLACPQAKRLLASKEGKSIA